MTSTIENLIGVFPNELSKEYCNKVCSYFEYLNGYDLTINRQEIDQVPISAKDDQQYYLGEELDTNRMLTNGQLAGPAIQAVTKCIATYADTVNGVSHLAKNLQILPFKIQRTKPGQGYHMWHHEQNSIQESNRLLSIIIYLNDINDGGETEFIHQSVRIPPRQGTVVIFPSSFTHTHRGNPPLKDTKYILSSWFALTK